MLNVTMSKHNYIELLRLYAEAKRDSIQWTKAGDTAKAYSRGDEADAYRTAITLISCEDVTAEVSDDLKDVIVRIGDYYYSFALVCGHHSLLYVD